METEYLLDACIVISFQQAGLLQSLCDAAERIPMTLVEEVYLELTAPRKNKQQTAARGAKACLDTSRIKRERLLIGSPEAALFARLHQLPGATTNRGESACIALAQHRPHLCFVTADSSAAFRALQELRGRTTTVHPFLRTLTEQGTLNPTQATHLGTQSWLPPTWWPTWLTTLPP